MEMENSKQSAPALPTPSSAPTDDALATVQTQIKAPVPSASGEHETKSITSATVVTSGQAVPPAQSVASAPTPSAAPLPEVDLRTHTASPSSPRTGRKKRSSQEFRFVSENSKLSSGLPAKRKRHSSSLVVFRLGSQARANGSQPGTPPANGSIPESVDVKSDVHSQSKHDDSLSKRIHAGVVLNGRDGLMDGSAYSNALPISQDTSETTQAHHESQPAAIPAAEEPGTWVSESTATPASDRSSEDVEMVDQLQDSDIDTAKPSREPTEVDCSDKARESGAGGLMMDVKVEPSAGQSGSDAVALGQLRPSLMDEPHANVATFEAPASTGLDHTQPGTVVKAHTGNIAMQVDAQHAADISPLAMTSTSASIDTPPPATLEGVMQELAEKKGMPDTIVSRIVDAVSEEPQTAVSHASISLSVQLFVVV